MFAITNETLQGSPATIETSLTAIMSEDLTLAIDNLLLDDVAADLIRPPGLRDGVAGLTPSAARHRQPDRAVADIEALLDAIKPAIRPALIVATPQSVTLGNMLLPTPAIRAPFLPNRMVIAIDCAAFASILGTIDLSSTEEALVHMSDTPAQIGVAGSPNAVSAHDAVAIPNRDARAALDHRHRLGHASLRRNFVDAKCELVIAMTDIVPRDARRRAARPTSIIARTRMPAPTFPPHRRDDRRPRQAARRLRRPM